MDKIYYKGRLFAIRIKTFTKGSVPITEDFASLQLLTLKHKKGHQIKAHDHARKKRISTILQECLVVKRGKIRVDFYAPNKKVFKYIYLRAGEVIIILQGGHGVHFLEDSEIVELKNGPFLDDKIFI